MRKLTTEQRVQIVHMLCEGMSIRGIGRVTGRSKGAILKLLADLGEACADYHNEHVRGLRCKRVQCDEVWAFIGAKRKSVEAGKQGYGDAWTFTAIDRDSKIILSWAVGPRDGGTAWDFMNDVAGRVVDRLQLSTDGHAMYLDAVADNFGFMVDYGQLIKLFGEGEGSSHSERKYSPGQCCGVRREPKLGIIDRKDICTSHVERHNLSIRMHIRRFTRLTNAFSKKVENHCHHTAIFMVYYNFCKGHKTLNGATPAMAAGLQSDWWEVSDMVALLEDRERAAVEAGSLKRGPYRPRISE